MGGDISGWSARPVSPITTNETLTSESSLSRLFSANKQIKQLGAKSEDRFNKDTLNSETKEREKKETGIRRSDHRLQAKYPNEKTKGKLEGGD